MNVVEVMYQKIEVHIDNHDIKMFLLELLITLVCVTGEPPNLKLQFPSRNLRT